HSCDGADEAQSAQRRHDADRAHERHGATLPRRTWRAEIGVSHHDKGERIEGRSKPVMKLGADLSRLVGKHHLGARRIVKLPQIAFPHGIFEALIAIRKPGQVEPIAVEEHERRIALSGLMALHTAVLQHEKYAAPVLYDVALLGQDGRSLLRVALVVDEDAEQLSSGASLANVQREPLFQFDETARLYDVGDKIGANFGCPPPQFAQSPRRDIDAKRGHEPLYDQSRRQEGTE